MNMFFDWWFATSPRLRQLCWAFWLLMLVTLIFLSSTHHEERNVSVSRFSLSVEGDDLLFTLQLETPHEG